MNRDCPWPTRLPLIALSVFSPHCAILMPPRWSAFVTNRLATWTTPLTEHEGLETFTDWQGFAWCLSSDGRRAVLKYGPANANGRYDWRTARAIGLEVDLSRPAHEYKDTFKGPCQFEVFTFLLNRIHRPDRAKSTALMSCSPLRVKT
jgi:hypothetical protein